MKRVLDILYKSKNQHIGSCLTVTPILEEIYNTKKENDIVVLSAGHAGVAQYVQIEKHSNGKINAEDLLDKMGIHPKRDVNNGIYVTSGSLGSAILISIGLAIADKTRNVYCVISDGECAEGNVWEGLAFCKKMNLQNIIIHVNINGYSAYGSVDRTYLEERLKVFFPPIIIHQTKNPAYLKGLDAYYHIIKNTKEINKILL